MFDRRPYEHPVFAVVSKDPYGASPFYVSEPTEGDILRYVKDFDLTLLEWCGTEEAALRSIRARLWPR